jgi:hypothetical protein
VNTTRVFNNFSQSVKRCKNDKISLVKTFFTVIIFLYHSPQAKIVLQFHKTYERMMLFLMYENPREKFSPTSSNRGGIAVRIKGAGAATYTIYMKFQDQYFLDESPTPTRILSLSHSLLFYSLSLSLWKSGCFFRHTLCVIQFSTVRSAVVDYALFS